jgi:anthranilate synthase component 2
MHGKKDLINIDNHNPLFNGLNDKIVAARYHSLMATNVPDSLKVIATSRDGVVMGVKHKDKRIYGIQFHPESILTPTGKIIIKNFLKEGK